MIDCIILGDSIAHGIADVRQDCIAYAQVGISSREWNRRFGNRDLTARVVVISLGSNDDWGSKTRSELEAIRHRAAGSCRVLWILPAIKPAVRDIIFAIADAAGDDVLELLHVSSDGVHPTGKGYTAIGKKF